MFHYTKCTITCVAEYFLNVSFYQSTQIIQQVQLQIITLILIQIENKHNVNSLTLPSCTKKNFFFKFKNCRLQNLRLHYT